MPCFGFQDPKTGARGIICTPRGRGKKCFAQGCPGRAHWLCDFPTAEGKTCDRNICDRHRRGVGPGKDYCLEHYFAEERRKAQ